MQDRFLLALVAVLSAMPLVAHARSSGHSGGGHSGGHSSSHSRGASHSHASPGGSHSIKGYTKKGGTRVAPAHATNPNKSKRDNYSSKGNVNPHTGKQGTKDPSKP